MSEANPFKEAFDLINAKLDRLLAQTGPKRPAGDEQIFKDPKEKYWDGESYAGGKLSEAPADYLYAYAKYKSACAWANRKEGDPKKAQYAEKDDTTAKLAIAWAEYRESTGATVTKAPAPKKQQTESGDDFGPPPDEDSVPF